MAVAQARVRRISPRRRLTNTVLLGLCGLAGLGSAAILTGRRNAGPEGIVGNRSGCVVIAAGATCLQR